MALCPGTVFAIIGADTDVVNFGTDTDFVTIPDGGAVTGVDFGGNAELVELCTLGSWVMWLLHIPSVTIGLTLTPGDTADEVLVHGLETGSTGDGTRKGTAFWAVVGHGDCVGILVRLWEVSLAFTIALSMSECLRSLMSKVGWG